MDKVALEVKVDKVPRTPPVAKEAGVQLMLLFSPPNISPPKGGLTSLRGGGGIKENRRSEKTVFLHKRHSRNQLFLTWNSFRK